MKRNQLTEYLEDVTQGDGRRQAVSLRYTDKIYDNKCVASLVECVLATQVSTVIIPSLVTRQGYIISLFLNLILFINYFQVRNLVQTNGDLTTGSPEGLWLASCAGAVAAVPQLCSSSSSSLCSRATAASNARLRLSSLVSSDDTAEEPPSIYERASASSSGVGVPGSYTSPMEPPSLCAPTRCACSKSATSLLSCEFKVLNFVNEMVSKPPLTRGL